MKWQCGILLSIHTARFLLICQIHTVWIIREFRLWKFRSWWNQKSNIIIIAIDFDQSNDGRKGFKLKWSTDPSSSRPDFTNWSAADASKYTQGNDYNFSLRIWILVLIWRLIKSKSFQKTSYFGICYSSKFQNLISLSIR